MKAFVISFTVLVALLALFFWLEVDLDVSFNQRQASPPPAETTPQDRLLVCNLIIVFVEKWCSFVSDAREEPTVFLVILTKEAWAVLSLDSHFKSLPTRLLRQIPNLFLVILHTVEL